MEDDRAVGVELEGGQRHAAGTVISAADGRWTISEALGGRYVDAAICDLHDGKTMDLSDAVIPVSLGVARTFEREPWLFRFPFADPPVPPDRTRHERMNTHIMAKVESLLSDKFVCAKCEHKGAHVEQLSMSGTGISRLLEIQAYRYAFVSCNNCGYTEVYNLKTLQGKDNLGKFLEILFMD